MHLSISLSAARELSAIFLLLTMPARSSLGLMLLKGRSNLQASRHRTRTKLKPLTLLLAFSCCPLGLLALNPASCGDYASGTNHTLPTYGYARMYSGVNTGTFVKHITSQLISSKGLDMIGDSVTTLAAVEELEAHRNSVAIRFLFIFYIFVIFFLFLFFFLLLV